MSIIGNTRIQLVNGSVVQVSQLDNGSDDCLAVGIAASNLKLESSCIKMVKEIYPQTTRTIVTKWGERLTGTNDQLLLSNKNGHITWIHLGELELGDYVAAPRVLSNQQLIPGFVDMLPQDETFIYDSNLVQIAKVNYLGVNNIRALAINLNISPGMLYAFKYHGQSVNVSVAKALCVPIGEATLIKSQNQSGKGQPLNLGYTDRKTVLSDLCYMAGIINSDGTLTSPTQVQFVNTDSTLHDRFIEIVNKMGLIKTHQRNRGKTIFTTVGSKTLNMILRWIWVNLTKLHPDLIASFLKGYADGDGAISKEYIRFCTTSTNKADKLQAACLLLGVVTYRESKNREVYNQSLIVHRESTEQFAKLIGFRQCRRQEKLSTLIDARWVAERLDVIPASEILSIAYYQGRELGLRTRSFMPLSNSLISDMLNGKAASRSRLSFVVSRLSQVGVNTEELDKLIDSNVIWEQITGVTDNDFSTDDLYSVRTNKGDSFIANGLITKGREI